MTTARDSQESNREVLVLLSSPGDVPKERDRVDRVVMEIDALTRHLGITTRSWRYERDATPAVSDSVQGSVNEQIPEYDVYVGVLCERLGSGTLEEFEAAMASHRRCGRPAVFFYFCSHIEEGAAADEGVPGFQGRYPGLYRVYADEDDLAETLKHDLLLWVFRDLLAPQAVAPRNASTAAFPHRRSIAAPGGAYPPGVLRLANLMPLGRVLDDAEFASLTDDEAPGNPPGASAPVRRDLIEGLRELANALGEDRSGAASGFENDGDAKNWIRWATREIRVRPGGFVQFVLEVPGVDWIAPAKRCTALRLEALWQKHRAALSSAGLAVVVEPSVIVLARPPSPAPDGLLERVEQLAAEVVRPSADLDHLGDASLAGIDVAHLVPLPGTAFVESVELPRESDRPHDLVVWGDGGEALERAGSSLRLGPADVAPGSRVDWELRTRSRTGDLRTVRCGWLRRLGPAEERMARAAKELPARERVAIWRRLGLFDEVLRDLHPRLDTASAEERHWLLGILQFGLAYLLERGVTSSQVDVFRRAAEHLQSATLGRES